jgi:hypothetical protein
MYARWRYRELLLELDPEKQLPVFGKDHAQQAKAK